MGVSWESPSLQTPCGDRPDVLLTRVDQHSADIDSSASVGYLNGGHSAFWVGLMGMYKNELRKTTKVTSATGQSIGFVEAEGKYLLRHNPLHRTLSLLNVFRVQLASSFLSLAYMYVMYVAQS